MAERRRGADLENAILDAAWAEIGEKGYAGLTMENTAARAGTSRPVLSRRWSSVLALATAAIQRELGAMPVIFITATPAACRPCPSPACILSKPVSDAAVRQAFRAVTI